MKICPNCGETENPDIAKFCKTCRHEFKKKSGGIKKILTGLLVLVILGAGAYFLYPYLAEKGNKESGQTVRENVTDNTVQEQKEEKVPKRAKKDKDIEQFQTEKKKKEEKNLKEKEDVKESDTVVDHEPGLTPKQPEPVYVSTATYTGYTLDGKKHGSGTYRVNGKKYVGEWRNDNIISGEEYESEKLRYKGDFANGRYNGYGIYYYNDGRRYEGQFRNGTQHGEGMFYYKNGKTEKGIWENGEFKGK